MKHITFEINSIKETKNKCFKTVIKDDIGFFCIRCFMPIFAKTIYNEMTIAKTRTYDNVYMNLSYHIKCPRCGYEFDWNTHPLDPNITKALAILNSKGYKTLFSCEGHSKIARAYIYFRYKNQRHVLKYIPIDEPWYKDTGKDISYILKPYNIKVKQYFSNYFCIRARADSTLEDRVNSLNKWVKRLPECRTFIFYKRYIQLPLDSEIVKEN